MVQQITNADKNTHQECSVKMLDWIGNKETFPDYVIFNDESTFHISGKVNNPQLQSLGL